MLPEWEPSFLNICNLRISIRRNPGPELALSEPVQITEKVLGDFKFDITVTTSGGGKEGQINAARLGIAKALVKFTEKQELRDAMLKYDRHLLVADTRRKEAYKPGDSKARAKRQSSKR